jgi:fructosamine-3-kinase
MPFDTSVISPECASVLLTRFLGRPLVVTGVRRLHGGMINSVLELTTNGTPERVVAKLNARPNQGGFEWERRVLQWYRTNTGFPVPEPFGCDISGRTFHGSCLMMERLPGLNLGEARLPPAARAELERQMARTVADLHRHRRATYGSALDPEQAGPVSWLEVFSPAVRSEFETVADRLTPQARAIISRELDVLDRWLPESGQPTLVHGDLWATNIIVDPTVPRLTGFVDGGARYTDVEYELAYLLVFHTVGDAFFDEYTHYHDLREGFDVRCRIYWLNTMLLHIRYFGDAHYVAASERLARELDRLAP